MNSIYSTKENTELTENDVLASLEEALSSYKAKDFKAIAKKSLENSRAPKRKKNVLPETFKQARKSKLAKKKVSHKGLVSSLFSKRKILDTVGSGLKSYTHTYKKQFLTITLTFIMFAFVGLSSYVAYAYVASNRSNIVERVNEHAVLPQNETPKVYIIQSEKSDIFQDPLFKGIEVGDNVLSYTNAGVVVVYRGSEDKIVNIVRTSAEKSGN